MANRWLSGAEAPFSNCFPTFIYRYRGSKLTDREKISLQNIYGKNTDFPTAEEASLVSSLQDRFNVRKAKNFNYPVIVDSEEVDITAINQSIDESVQFFQTLSGKNYDEVIISSIAGNKIRDRVVDRPGVECAVGFIFRYSTQGNWNEEILRDAVIRLDERNTDIRRIVNIPKDSITEDEFSLTGGIENELEMQFTLNSDRITLDELRALTNAVDGFASKASTSRQPPDKEVNVITVV